MTTLITTRLNKFFSVAGSLISLAIVFGGSTSFAEGFIGIPSSTGSEANFIGSYSDADLASLDHATKAEATAARLAAMGELPIGGGRTRANAATQTAEQASVTDITAFKHSSRILPLLVANPRIDASSTVAVASATKMRPGLTRPVGVQPSAVR